MVDSKLGIERYSPSGPGFGSMRQNDDGGYVLYNQVVDIVEALREQRDRLREAFAGSATVTRHVSVSQSIPPHVRNYDQDTAWVGGGDSMGWFESSGDTGRSRGSNREPQDTVGAVYDSMATHGEPAPHNNQGDVIVPNPHWESFGKAIMEAWPGEGVDGGELQEAAEHYGILRREPGGYDPEKHGDEWADRCEPGDRFYVRNYYRESHAWFEPSGNTGQLNEPISVFPSLLDDPARATNKIDAERVRAAMRADAEHGWGEPWRRHTYALQEYARELQEYIEELEQGE